LTPILYPIVRKWKEIKLWKYKHKTKEDARQMHTFRDKDDNAPLKFKVLIENIALKDHNSYKNGLENIEL
jgi:hypothetical protein